MRAKVNFSRVVFLPVIKADNRDKQKQFILNLTKILLNYGNLKMNFLTCSFGYLLSIPSNLNTTPPGGTCELRLI